MFRHFISAEPKRKPTKPSDSKKKKVINWLQLGNQWLQLGNQWQDGAFEETIQHHREKMQLLEEYLFDEDGGYEEIIDAWSEYSNYRHEEGRFSILMECLMQEVQFADIQPYLTTLFYDAVLYNDETYENTLSELENTVSAEFLHLLKNDKSVLICALEPGSERNYTYSLNAITVSGDVFQMDTEIWCEYILNRDASFLTELNPELIDDYVIDTVIRGLENLDEWQQASLLEILFPYLQSSSPEGHPDHRKKQQFLNALPYYEDLLARSECWQDNPEIVLEAVELWGSVQLNSAAEDLYSNGAFMLAAIDKNYACCEYAAEDLLSENGFVSAAMSTNANVFRYLLEPARKNADFIERAVKAHWENFQFAHNHKRGLLLIPAEDDNPARLQEIQAENIQEIQADGREMVSYLLSNVTRCGQLVQYTPFTNNATIMEQAIRNRSGSIFYLGLVLKYNPEFLYKMLQRVTTGVWMAVWNRLFRQDKLLGQLRFFQPPASTYIFEVGILLRLNQSRSCLHFFIQYRYWLEHQAELLNPTLIADTVSHILKFTNT